MWVLGGIDFFRWQQCFVVMKMEVGTETETVVW
jgi:hypothetical protein